MKNKLIALGLILFSQQLLAQRLSFGWEATPKVHTAFNPEFLKESAIMMHEKVQVEYSYTTKGVPMLTRRVHRIIKVNDEKGIEIYNKLKINYREDYPIRVAKARTILPSGKVFELKPDAFKVVKEDDGTFNKIAAMEGVEKGAELEYIFEILQPLSFFGSYMIQDVMPTCKSEIEIVSPKNLIFELKGYNNVTVAKDSLMNDKNCFYASAENLPGLEEEKMATYLPYFARLEYSLAYNVETKGKGTRILTWDDAAKNLYKEISSLSEKEIKPVTKLLQGNKDFQQCKTIEERIAWIENFVKSSYVQQDYVTDEKAETLDFILKNKLTNETGVRVLLTAMFQSQGIPFEVGYTTDRFTKAFDFSFPNWENLKNCLFYFPDTKQYIAPNETTYRLPFIPARWTGNNAMFCKVIRMGEAVTASAEKRKIPEMPAAFNYHNHEVEVFFNQDIDTSTIRLRNILMGYNALELLPIFVYLEKEKRDDATKEIFKLSDRDEKMDQITYENTEFNAVTKNKPLIIEAVVHATGNIEKAGNKYLFHVGELIGRQSEMYQEKDRQFDLEIPNAHQYTRTLKVHIPDGYKANNLDNLNMNVLNTVDGKENCKFISSYKLHDNTLDITVFEVYHNILTPKSEYENYRKVINAAADFNKVVIVFEKI